MWQKKIDWPDKNKQKSLNELIFSSSYEPFALASYKRGQEITDFVGRKNELTYFKSYINSVVQFGKSKAVRLEGPAGVGKSTLFNYLKQSIEQERTKKGGYSEFITMDTDIITAYFEIQDQILEYRNIFRPLFETLVGTIATELSEDIGFPEYVALNIILFLLKENPSEVGQIIWDGNIPIINLNYVGLKDIIDPIMNNPKKVIPQLQEYFKQNARRIRPKFNTKINNHPYNISRRDTSTIVELFRSLDELDDYLEKVNSADSTLFPTDDELIAFFNSLLRFCICVTKKQPILLVGIDEIAKSDHIGQDAFYHQLGNLFVALRNKLDFTLFVFISTTEDWAQYDRVLLKYTDLNNQISDFMEKMVLTPLTIDDVSLIFQNRMNQFWNRFQHIRLASAPFYPFSKNTFEYAYRFKNNDLRLAIHLLRDIWRTFKVTKIIPCYRSKFDSMRNIRQFMNTDWKLDSIRKFEWNLITQEFEKPGRFKTNSLRSASVESALENSWRILMNSRITQISKVENNPVIKIDNHSHRPDVVIKLNESMGQNYQRVIEFQVKVYEKNSYVILKHIESSLTLFEKGHTDFLYFIITGKGLSPTAMQRVELLRKKYPNRIRTPTLNANQIKYLYFLVLFNEITGTPLSLEHENLVYNALEIILNQKPESLIREVVNFPVREDIEIKHFYDSEPLQNQILTNQKAVLSSFIPNYIEHQQANAPIVDDITESTPQRLLNLQNQIQKQPISSSENALKQSEKVEKAEQGEKAEHTPLESWLNNYPFLKPFQEEICGLCQFMQKRESGRYKGKFTDNVIIKNVIVGNPSLSKSTYREMVKQLLNKGFLIKEKTSFLFTEKGWNLYWSIKKANFLP
ncbi:MAG: hypothetical protein K9W44_10905 [Candidatus Lokiarchaeota archaeon]|nr:hypothetical protein [Candidatus Harpocratesius repetitus]